MRKTKSRALIADGDKVRSLRSKTGKSQKKLLRDTKVGIRTYQRAEQGLAISPGVLREIASLFNAPLASIVQESKSKEEPQTKHETLRLHPCDGKGGLKIVRELQTPNRIRFDFRVDPYGDTATMMADVVRFCEMNKYTTQAGHLGDAEFIEAVGELNAKIAELYHVGVNIHFARYLVWDVEGHELPNGKCVRFPECNGRLLIMFSEESGVVYRRLSQWETRENVEDRCHRRNFEDGVLPTELRVHLEEKDGPFVDYDFVAAYEAHIEQMVANAIEIDRSGPREPPLRLIGKS